MRNNPPAYGVPAAKYVQITKFLNFPLKIYIHNVLFDCDEIPFINFFFRTFNNNLIVKLDLSCSHIYIKLGA